jgi:hypothetical protein
MDVCILCFSKAVINNQESAARTIYNCPLCGTFVVSDMAVEQVKAEASRIASFMMSRKNFNHSDTILITKDHIKIEKDYLQISVAEIVARYPQDFRGKIQAALRNLVDKSTYPGASVSIDRIELCPWLYVENHKEAALSFMLHAMQEEKLVSIQSRHGVILPCSVTVTAKGWRIVEEFSSDSQKTADKVLVLGSNDEYCKAVKKACKNCGYQIIPVEVTDISPAVIAHIKSASLVICEVSDASSAVYYAAGIARALDKLDILTCDVKKRGEIPFACEQMAILTWATPEELSSKITYTIKSFAE